MDDGDVGFMLRHGVATSEEIQNLNRELDSLIRNLRLGQATENEFLQYIHTEMRLMDDCRRIIEADLKMADNVHDNIQMLTNFCKNIFNMFKTMFNKFPVCNLSLRKYIDFCLDNKELLIKCKNYLSDITSAYHKDPEVYITVAMFMYEEYNDIEEARRHFYRGTIHHKNYKPLYIEEFSMEIQNLEKTDGATIEFALENYYSVKELFKGQMDVHFMLLDKTMRMTRVMNVLNVIVEDMIMEYKHSSFMWQKLALINEKGFIYDHALKLVSYSYCVYCNILNFVLTYEYGLESVSMYSEYLKLWQMYLDHLKVFVKSSFMKSKQIGDLINTTLKRAFHKAHENGAIRSVQYYIYWASLEGNIDIILKSQELIYAQLKLGTKIINRYMTAFNFDEFFNVAFIICFPSLKNKNFSLSHIIHTFMNEDNNLCLLELLLNNLSYVDGLTFRNKCFNSLQKNFSSLKMAASVILEIIKIHPEKFDHLFDHLLKYFAIIIRFKIFNIRHFAMKCCLLMGKWNVDLWIDYMRFEYVYMDLKRAEIVFYMSLHYLNANLHVTMKKEFLKLLKMKNT